MGASGAFLSVLSELHLAAAFAYKTKEGFSRIFLCAYNSISSACLSACTSIQGI
jgi:hypothetical protein